MPLLSQDVLELLIKTIFTN